MVTLNELKTGSRVFVSLPELAQLLGLSKISIYRRNLQGGWLSYFRDPVTKRIYYDATDILKHIESLPKFKSTSQYPTHEGISKMEHARNGKKAKAR